jgi:hypothetical protein
MQKKPDDDFWNCTGVFHNKPCPSILLLSSPTVDSICQRSNLTLKELFEPFAAISVNGYYYYQIS